VVVTLAFKRSNSVINNKHSLGNSSDENFISDSVVRMFMSRRDYYRDVYLKSDEWKRKRYVVFRRDNWRCVYCGARATQVHHKKYAKGILERSQSTGSSLFASLVMTLNITN